MRKIVLTATLSLFASSAIAQERVWTVANQTGEFICEVTVRIDEEVLNVLPPEKCIDPGTTMTLRIPAEVPCVTDVHFSFDDVGKTIVPRVEACIGGDIIVDKIDQYYD